MPATHPRDARRGQLLHGLFWGGLALAPLAVLILLFGQSTAALRIAVTLAVLTIVMLAVSIALRPSVEMVRVDIEHRFLDEVERVRARTREETAMAARNTHRALTDKIHVLTETMEDLRGQFTETMEDLRGQIDEMAAGGVPAPHSAPALDAPAGGPAVVRRTETVHVTRHTTTVDAGDDDRGGTIYGSRAAMEGEWREQQDRRPDDRRFDDRHDDRRDDRRWDERWDGMASGGRWAEVRADEHGRELHLGERRTSMHSDDRGAEYRMEDRWAAHRRDDPRGSGYSEPDWEGTFRSLSRPSSRALPPATGDPPGRYVEDRHRDEDRYRDDDRYREPARSRGRERDERDRDRPRDDWERRFDPPRGQDDRDRDRAREPDRYRDEDDRDYGRGRERDFGYRDDRYPPRPRPPHPTEYDR